MTRALRFATSFVVSLALIAGVWLSLPAPVHAQITDGLTAVGGVTGLSSADPRVIAARIINVALGLLALIFLVLVIYAGFLWMTSGGDSGNAEKARTLLKNAVIGLIIILCSWAITRYVISRLLAAVNSGTDSDSPTDGDDDNGFGGGPTSSFQIRSILPSGSIAIRNFHVTFLFTRDVDGALVPGSVHVYKAEGRTPVDGTFTVNGAMVDFVPSAICDTAPSERCFDRDTDYIAVVDTSFRSLATAGQVSQRIICGGLSLPCQVAFRSGNLIDLTPPTALLQIPYDGQSVPLNNLITISTRAIDDAAVAYVTSSVDTAQVGIDAPTTTVATFTASIPWSTAGVATGTHALRSQANDLAFHSGMSSVVRVAVLPEHCFNLRQDADETGPDCGGTSCLLCDGSSCTPGPGGDIQCRGGGCDALPDGGGVCRSHPVILNVSPDDGRPGTIVTISGANFGINPGAVHFWDGSGFTIRASAPAVCAVGSTWSSGQIFVEVPVGAVTGPIRVTHASSTFDTTNGGEGPVLDNFVVNTSIHPGLCAATPSTGQRGDVLTLTGTGLGATPGRIFFSDRDQTPSSFATPWTDTRVGMQVPIIAAGTYPVRVQVGGQDSNRVAFTVTERVRGNPTITTIDPVDGPIGEYVTLRGRDFGTTIGQVKFRNVDTGEVGNADVTFPAACSLDYWRDTNVTVKVPPTVGLRTPVTPGSYQVYLIRNGDNLPSNRMAFTVNTDPLSPGVCAVTPLAGPVGTVLSVNGERFGSAADSLSFQGSTAETRVNASTVSTWTDTGIIASVPSGAYTGPVRVDVGATHSNGVSFAVQNCNEDAAICGVESCCADSGQCSVRGVCAQVASASMYGWEMSTGQLPIYPEVIEECTGRGGLPPSPSPWDGRAGGNQVCVNAETVVRFNTELDHTTLNQSNIVISRCTATGNNPCATKVNVPLASGRFEVGYSDGVGSARRSMFTFDPSGGWVASSIYEVAITTGIMSSGRVAMRASERCAAGVGYCFRFETRASTEPCRLGSVGVTPNPYTAKDIGEKVAYRGNALSAQDQCLQINPASLDWSWYTGRTISAPDSRATLTPYVGPDCVADPTFTPVRGSDGSLTYCPWRQTAAAQNETGPTDPVRVNAQAANPGDVPVVGTGLLYIQFVPPQVVSHGPECDQACTEAKIWAEFNVPMNPALATERQVLLYRCANENCRSFSPSTPLVLAPGSVRLVASLTATTQPNNRRLEISPIDLSRRTHLQAGAFYKVILRADTAPCGGALQPACAGLRSRTDLALTALNDRQGFSWRFRVKPENNGMCDVTRVDVTPIEKVETVIAARELFSADPVSVTQACGTQYLMSEGVPYAWTTQNPDVSKFINGNGDGMCSISSALPANCSGRCVNMGAEGVDGRIASCGNTMVETTDADYCRRRSGADCTPGNTDCVVRTDSTRACKVLEPGSQGGEECDYGNADTGGTNGVQSGLCGVNCLWTGVTGGTCGNARIEQGEQCDPGLACVGGTAAGTACVSDAPCAGGGRCGLNTQGTGCTVECKALGSSSVTTAGESSQCGNHSLGAGETCDDGNRTDGDGCSSECLHEGSYSVTAICGNGAIESGESCERGAGGVWPAGCDRVTCLNQGTNTCNFNPGADPSARLLCCGNGASDPGEDCDDSNGANGDGCSSRCLAEGASIAYRPTPSICGDGILPAAGKQCDAPPGSGVIASRQVSEIVGAHEPDSSGLMMSRLEATYRAKVGAASHGLQCGFRQEIECVGDLSEGRTIQGYGLTTSGCCMERPRVTNVRFPLPDATAVCRNTEISFNFSQLMSAGSINANLIIGEEVTDVCPAGTTSLGGSYARTCIGGVSGTARLTTAGGASRVVFSLRRALKATTKYRIVVKGDPNLSDTTRVGVQNSNGTVMAGDATWLFTTGDRICAANHIAIADTHPDHPYLYQVKNESHDFTATVQSSQNGILVPISSVEEYGWAWQPWLSSDTRILTVGATETDRAQQASTSTLRARERTGSSYVFAGIVITQDTVNVPTTVDQTIEASHLVNVVLCERPWPAVDSRYRNATMFSDSRPVDGESSVLTGTIFAGGPYYNFGTFYCMDAGTGNNAADDLPALTIRPTPVSTSDRTRNLLRQYLFTFEGSSVPQAMRKDAIGVRVFDNSLHLSPSAWYASQGFLGSPQSLSIDGYDAIRDGNSLYVGAPNVDSSTLGAVTSTIYLISYNPDAESKTQNIFDQLVDNWIFNVNIQRDSSNVCMNGSRVFVDRTNRTVACTSDWECAGQGEALTCASFKAKIQRDGKRLNDFQLYMTKLEEAKTRDGRYPTVSSGSYLQGMTTSRWGSWQAVLGAALGKDLPIDPVNRFLTCGRCQYVGSTAVGEPCIDASDCRVGGTCAGVPRSVGAAAAYDPATCWEATSQRFLCPRLPSGPSRFYQYRSLGNGVGYELGTELEAASYDRYQPVLLSGVKKCSNTQQLCTIDADCVVYYAGTTREQSRGTCQPSGGQWRYSNVCTGREFGTESVCGDGVRSAVTEACEVNDSATASCVTADNKPGMKQQVCSLDCRGFVDGPSTRCVALSLCGNGRVDQNICVGPGVKYGQPCTTLTTGASAECSDARDPAGSVTQCVSMSSVSRAGSPEVCDDGAALNGTYGHCNRTCSGFDNLCGDGLLSVGEVCDKGGNNGQYCDPRPVGVGGGACNLSDSCGFDCRSQAPFCGNGTVEEGDGEQCEPGESDISTSAVCSSGPFAGQKICQTNADCADTSGRTGVCGVDAVSTLPDRLLYNSCVGQNASRCVGFGKICELGDRRRCEIDSDCAPTAAGGRCVERDEVDCSTNTACGPAGRCVVYSTQRTRTCGPQGAARPASPAAQCQWAGWGSCQPKGSCGDGVKDVGETCDDGNTSDNDACTSQCQENVCGDGALRTGTEQCDYGDVTRGGRNGLACSSEYGASCVTCTPTCRVQAQSGGFCGDGTKNGREQCDFVGVCTGGTRNTARCTDDSDCTGGGRCTFPGVAAGATCRSIGFDYATNSICNTHAYITNPSESSIVCVTDGTPSGCTPCSLLVSAMSMDPVRARARLAALPPGLDGEAESGLYDPGSGGTDVPPPVTGTGVTLSVGYRIGSGVCQPCRGGSCVAHPAATAQRVTTQNQAACMAGTAQDYLSCSTSCSTAGCGSCLTAPTSGNAVTISGSVFDRSVSRAIPGARVVLTYRGNTIADTVADNQGRFRIPNLHGRQECGQYRLTVAMERDNPNTTTTERFGYRPFDSGVFSPVDFGARIVPGGRIELTPRTDDTDGGGSVGLTPNETRVVVTWNGTLPLVTVAGRQYVRSILPHLVVPNSRQYQKLNVEVGGTYSCPTLSSVPTCAEMNDGRHGRIECTFSTDYSAGFFCGRALVTAGGLVQACRPVSVAAGQTGSEVTEVRAVIAAALQGRGIPIPTDTNEAYSLLERYRIAATCTSPLRLSNGTVVGYRGASCSPGLLRCAAGVVSNATCCSNDFGTARSWEGVSPITTGSQVIATCAPHRITTQAYCDQLRAGRVSGVEPEAQGADGALTQLACQEDSPVCDEFVRTATNDDPMLIRYVRSNAVGETYRFYLEQRPYAEAEMTGGVSVPTQGLLSDGSACGDLISRRLDCSDRSIACRDVTVGGTPITCTSNDPASCTLPVGVTASGVCVTRSVSVTASPRAALSNPARFMQEEMGVEVRILTSTQDVRVHPPADPGISCETGMGLWHVFNQDASTGVITPVTTNQFSCSVPAGVNGLHERLVNATYPFPLPDLR